MPGRFTLTTDAPALRAAFPWLEVPEQLQPRYNIAPNSAVAVVTNAAPDRVDFVTWGFLPSPKSGAKATNTLINARGESVAKLRTFRAAFRRRRCLVLADGVYEWVKQKGVKLKIPYYVYLKEHRPFAYAGIWDEWTSMDGSEVKSCAIITTEPNELIRPIHHRMGVILHEQDYETWLQGGEANPKELESLLLPYPSEEMAYHIVSTKVSDPRNNGPNLVGAVEGQQALL